MANYSKNTRLDINSEVDAYAFDYCENWKWKLDCNLNINIMPKGYKNWTRESGNVTPVR